MALSLLEQDHALAHCVALELLVQGILQTASLFAHSSELGEFPTLECRARCVLHRVICKKAPSLNQLPAVHSKSIAVNQCNFCTRKIMLVVAWMIIVW